MLDCTLEEFQATEFKHVDTDEAKEVLYNWYVDNGVEITLEQAAKSEQFKEYTDSYVKAESLAEALSAKLDNGNILIENY